MGGFGLVALAVLTVVSCFQVNRDYYSAKYDSPAATDPLLQIPDPLQPILQRDGHTCGFLAASAVYRAYGLDPDSRNLRFRLGVDAKAIPGDSTSTGTLHPDLFRVLEQDGFRFSMLDPNSADAARQLKAHVEHDAALILILHNGGMHWVALDRGEHGNVRVADSIGAEVSELEVGSFLAGPILSVLLLQPALGHEARSTRALHALGLQEMALAYQRMDAEQ